MAERIYIVHGPQGTRLVKASLRQQALSHVANSTFNIAVATQDELVKAITEGTKVGDTGTSNALLDHFF
jgi:hypothetical protein